MGRKIDIFSLEGSNLKSPMLLFIVINQSFYIPMRNFEAPDAGIEKKVFTEVAFRQKKDKKGQLLAFESSELGRKTIRLASGVTPKLDTKYDVRVIEDSNPSDPLSGYYVVEIVNAQNQNIDWPEVERVSDRASHINRQLLKSKNVLYDETGIEASNREGIAGTEILKAARRPRVAEKALINEDHLAKELEALLGDEKSSERKFVSFQYANLRSAISEDRKIEDALEDLYAEQTDILKNIGEVPTSAELEALDEIKEEILKLESRRDQLRLSSPEAHYGLHLKELKKYKSDLSNGKIVETPYVHSHIEDIVSHVRSGKPVMIYGHLGSGKTELALHVARNHILHDRPDIDAIVEAEYKEWLEKNPDASLRVQEKERKEIDMSYRSALVISGSKSMSTTELYGHQILDIEKIKKEELDAFIKDVELKYNAWLDENKAKLEGMDKDMGEEEKNRAHSRFLETYLTQFKGGTISNFFLGPIYRAMAEGRPIVIDEVNAIPHEVLISLNHILTRKVGEQINVQQNSGSVITVKEGYGVIMTGNLNQGDGRYVDRQDMDPALLSRLYKIEYDYLPQVTEGSLEDEVSNESQLFHLLIARIMDSNGNMHVPKDAVDKLWNLAKAARIIQNVFAGKEVDSAFYFKEGGSRPVKYILRESVLSIRGLDKIITQWQKEGYQSEIDYYLWKEFVSQSTNPMDKSYLYQVLQDQFGFFGEGWPQRPSAMTGGKINSLDINPPRNEEEPITFYGPRETVDFAFGKASAPKRKAWPGGVDLEKKTLKTR